jgi:hypothetical protein
MDQLLASNHSHATARLASPLVIEKHHSVSRNTSDHMISIVEDGKAMSTTPGYSIGTKDAQLHCTIKPTNAKSGFGRITGEKTVDEAISDRCPFRHDNSTLDVPFRRMAPCNINNRACQNREFVPLFMHGGEAGHEKSGFSTSNTMDQMTWPSKEVNDPKASRMETAFSPLLSSIHDTDQNGADRLPSSRLCDTRESRLTSRLAKFHKRPSASVRSATADRVAERSRNAIQYRPCKELSVPLHRLATQKPLTAAKPFQVTDQVNAFLQARGKAAPGVKRPRLDASTGRSNTS